MLYTALIAGFTLGAAGSLHCIGMCGPLSLVLPTHHLSSLGKFFSLLLYQFGRIITYSLLGLVFGLAGRSIYLAGFQHWFSITTGSIILLLAMIYFLQKKSIHFIFFERFYSSVRQLISTILKHNNGYGSFLLLGMANGLLPCGMVYVALAATLSFNQVDEGIAFMAMFGAGTLPAMLVFSYVAQLVKPTTRKLFRNSVPVLITLTGILLILRGLNLGIEFISPQLPKAAGAIVSCGH